METFERTASYLTKAKRRKSNIGATKKLPKIKQGYKRKSQRKQKGNHKVNQLYCRVD